MKNNLIDELALKIKRLEQENERLENNNQAMQEEMARTWEKENNYKSRIEKAVEYINNCPEYLWENVNTKELIDILNGRSDE